MKFITIDEVATVVRGSSPRPQGDVRYYGGNVPRLMVSDVTRDGMYVTPKLDFLTEEGATKSRPMKKGDFVIAVSGDPGEPCILTVDACIHDGFVGFRNLDISKVFTPYLYRFFKYNKLKSKSQAVGAIYKNLNTDQIKGIQIPLPPLPQQQKIANILDAADALRQNDKALIAKYDQLTQALFLDMFGDPVSSKIIELGEVIKLIGGGTPSKMIDEYWIGTIPWASVKDLKSDLLTSTIDHISEAAIANSATNLIPAGSLIIATRMAVGKAVICLQDTAINQDLKAVKIIGEANVKFLQHLFKSKESYFDSVSSGATVKGIKIEHITKLKVPFPPIELQNQFAKRVAVIEEQKAIAQKSLEHSEALFNSLLQKAFKGAL
jgi:type I restriction enzyme S subunit